MQIILFCFLYDVEIPRIYYPFLYHIYMYLYNIPKFTIPNTKYIGIAKMLDLCK